jgi:hypothetical protein
MLKLRIEGTGAIVSPSALESDSRFEVWRDGEGAVLAYAESVGDEYWMHLPGLASYRFSSRGDEIAATVTNGAEEELVLDAYRRKILPMALQVCGREVLHASAIRSPAGVAALCADSATGKSTIAFGLNSRGYPLWADDLVAFEISDQLGLAISLPFNLRLRPSAAALFDPDSINTLSATVDENSAPGKETAPLSAIFVLRRGKSDDAAVAVRRLSLGEAFAAVLAHAWSFGLQDSGRKRRMIHNYLDLVAGTPVFDICFEPGLANLPNVLDAIERAFSVKDEGAADLRG